ncbi:ARM repeat-containing protein [Coniophora puteana RWD-64-598 SS2]|uniref:ARM repeat-containing protein n=1 Tax=Coniophora puteana (strain RWD-64-598) TaxID=741705 RepID=A0A5M3MN64_CONPW|nr:ARM repeat-containing protein [Coniophora puteana RWD-64-598 SS2]EIW80155.1 ARM repeat-containing protein [Coniophora puteana RWD-64-598 SS2]
MESSVVPPEITAELTQILANLVLGDNNIRASAEKAVNDRLAQTPDLYLLALAQFAIAADTEIMRSFSLVLLRRLLFRPSAAQQQQPHQLPPKDPRMTLYDQLPVQALTTLERLLLHSLSHEASDSVRRKAVDTVTDLANNAMARGRPWHALQAQTFSMAQADRAGYRECAYRVFGGCPNLVMDLQTDAVLSVFQKGLQDGESTEVRHAALEACVSYLSASDAHQLSQSLSLLYPMLDTLPALPDAQLKLFLNTLIPLASSHPSLFAPHLPNLLAYMRALIMPAVDSGPTPTVSKPFPGSARRRGSAFTFPPEGHVSSPDEGDEDEEDKDAVRKAALELMVSLSEAKPAMVRRTDGWTLALVRACLEGMGELPEDGTEAWLEADPADETDEAYPHAYEQALDRLACALGGKAVLPPAFQYIPSMLADYDWRLRHAGLMAIAAIAEGTSKVMQNELGKVVELVTPMFKDAHPRVRYAACQCVGQLCTDLEEIIQERYHEQLFSALIPTLEAPEPRVHAHAAAALINFCEGVAHDTLVPYLDPIVERLLKLLDPHGEQGQRVKRYVQEQVITSLAMVADASEATFAKHYASIMPLLLNVLRNANSPEYHKIRVKAMECAGLIAIAVGRDVFRPDASTLIELLIKIQGGPHDPNDTLLANYLIATWAKICQAMGPDFEPYLPVVMPPLLNAANAKADVSVYADEDDENGYEEREGWETINMDGRIVGIRTSTIEEKCQAFETLLIYAATLDGRFAPYLTQALELALPALRFYFHEGVREAACRLIPTLFSCGKHSSTLSPQIVSASFLALVKCIATETDPSFLASLYRAFIDALLVIGGARALPPELQHGVLDATKHQLQALADRRKGRAERAPHELEDDRQELALIEEMEDYALEDVARLLRMFDAQHPLLVAVSSVRDLGFNQFDEDADEDG